MKLLLLGAGIRTPLLLHGLIRRQDVLGLREVALHDDDPARLATMGAFARALAERHGATFAVAAPGNLAEAARGAGFVFSAIRVGQETQRIADEHIPLRHGVLGQETTGPGGFAMALRTVPVLLRCADVLEAEAPGAWLVNFTNPAGLITQALRAHTGLKVVGICDTPTAMRASLARFLGRRDDELILDYAGLNHLGWVKRVLVDGEDVLPDLLARYDELAASSHEWSLFEPAFVRLLGLLPNEYLYYYYYRGEAVANIVASGGTRGEQIRAINAPLWRALGDAFAAGRVDDAIAVYDRQMNARNATYMARESGRFEETAGQGAATGSLCADEGYAGLALDFMTAVVGHRPTTLILNVPSDGGWQDVDPTDVVEVPCLVDAHGPRPLTQSPLPEVAIPLVAAIKAYERFAIDAAVTGSYDAAVRALTVHPLVASYPLARKIVDDFLVAHAAFLPQFGT